MVCPSSVYSNGKIETEKFAYLPMVTHKFQKVFKEFNITLASQNKFSIQNMIEANYKDKDTPNKKLGIY